MGVYRTSYLLYGFKFTDINSWKTISDKWDELMEEPPYNNVFNNSKSDQIIVFDGMCGNYVYFGIKLAEIDEYNDNASVEVSEDEIHNLNNKLTEYMKSWPNYLVKLCKDNTPKLHFFIYAH